MPLVRSRVSGLLNCSNRIASRSRSGRSSIRFGLSISVPAIPFNPSSKRAIMDFEQPIGDVNSVIRVDADQVGVEGRVVDFGQRQAMRDHRLF